MSKPLLEIENLSVGYRTPIVQNLNAKINQGEFVGLVGRNGSGKSTLLKTILGLQPNLDGSIQFFGEDIQNWSVQKRAKNIAVVFSRLTHAPSISVYEMIALGRLPYQTGFSKLTKEDNQKIEEALELVGITSLASKMTKNLSDGQLQMAMIARALVQDTPLIVMDEPTSHLDIENQFKIFELIVNLSKQTKKTFLVASHQIELLLQNSTQLWWIDQGSFYAGFPEDIAYEKDIFETLAQNQIKFDYVWGRFQYQHSKSYTVQFHSDHSKFAYWTKQALVRNGFEVQSNSETIIEIKDQKILVDSRTFESIQEFIQYLNTSLCKRTSS